MSAPRRQPKVSAQQYSEFDESEAHTTTTDLDQSFS